VIAVTVLQKEQLTINRKMIALFLVLAAGLACIMTSPDLFALYFLGSILVAVMVSIYFVADIRLKNILFMALCLRFMLALLQTYTAIDLPGAGADSIMFERLGWENAQAWLSGEPGIETAGAYYYSAIIGAFYYIFGRVPLLIQSLNIIVGLLVAYLTYLLGLLLTDRRRVATVAALGAAVFPTLNLLSVVILREIFLILFALLSFYFFVKWLRFSGYRHVLGSFWAIVAMALFHGAMLLVSWVQIICFSFFSPKEQKFKFFNYQFMIIIVFVLLLFFILSADIITYRVPSDFTSLISVETFQKLVEDRLVGRTQYLDGFVPESHFDVVWHTPVRIIFFMFAPFPWMIETVSDLFGFVEVLIYMALLYFSIIGVKQLINTHRVAVISMLLIVITIVFMFSWGTVNYGTAWRHRAKTAPFLIVMASTGIVAGQRWNWLFPDETDYTGNTGVEKRLMDNSN